VNGVHACDPASVCPKASPLIMMSDCLPEADVKALICVATNIPSDSTAFAFNKNKSLRRNPLFI